MKKQIINVPENINYISEWTGLQIPQGHLIMDKTITGCGFTEYFLHNSQNVVLCSPRKILLENKADQNKHVHYVKNELERTIEIDQDLNIQTNKIDRNEPMFLEDLGLDEQEKRKEILELKDRISQYLDLCFTQGRPFKILVTYDSIKHVLDVLKKRLIPKFLNEVQFVVDEFQSIFSDARFKGNVELDFIDYLQDYQNVCFLSATPTMEKYLEQMEEFKNLPYYKLIWPEDKIISARVIRKYVKSIQDEVLNIVTQYRNGQFPRKILEDKSIHESKEVVFYVNSVKTICSIIRKCKLSPAETNVICSRDAKNKKKLRAVKHDFGSVPLQDQPHKMFTFCTRTVYLGSDFYSKSAYTVVISDCNITTLSVDITLDLPQILGRQRLSENVFRNECLLFYKTQRDMFTFEDFNKKIDKQKLNSKNLFQIYDKCNTSEQETLLEKIKGGIFFEKYKKDFVSISSKTGRPAYNKLVELAEWRAWEVSQLDYQDDITMKKVLEDKNYTVEDLTIEYKTIDENVLLCNFMEDFAREPHWNRRMKLYCDFLDSYYDLFGTTDIGNVPREFQNYVNLLGTKRIKALEYRRNELENEYKIIVSQGDIKSLIHQNFTENSVLASTEIKSKLQGLYDNLGLKKKAKATDLGEYFEIEQFPQRMGGKVCKVTKILKIKD